MNSVSTLVPSGAEADHAVIELLARSDPEAIEMLYDRYGGLAYSVARGVLNDAAMAEDVVQEAFLSVWRRGATYRPERGGLNTWLCSIVRHRAVDRLRGRSGRALSELPLAHIGESRTATDAWDEVVRKLDADRLRQAVDALPAPQRQTIELAYYAGYTQTEISDYIRIPLGTVKARTRAALHKLRLTLCEPDMGWGAS